jgi:proliferating cell nuclear antigen PCNA
MAMHNGVSTMFSANLTDMTLLRESMSAIAEIIDEAELNIREDGWRMLAADRAVVAVVDFWLRKEAFTNYKFERDERIGLNLINFLRVLKRAMPNDVLSISLEGNKMQLQLTGDSVRTFSLPLIDVTKSELPPLDHLEFTSNFEITSDVLSSGIDDADLIADSLIFVSSSDGICFKSDSDSAGFELRLRQGSPGLKSMAVNSSARARYSLDYLKRIVKARRLADMAKIHFATEYPMKLVFEVPSKAQLTFILAPRREE